MQGEVNLMERERDHNPGSEKKKVSRLYLFFVIGVSTALPLACMGLNFTATSFDPKSLMPLAVFIVLIIMFVRETRTSAAKPKLLAYFLSFLGAFYPSVLVAIILWLIWWVSYGLAVVFGMEAGIFEAADRFATMIFGWLSLFLAIFLVRMNWRHLLNQLYPQVGDHSAFAQISATGKLWLIKRGVMFSFAFAAISVIYLAVAVSGSVSGMYLELSFGLYFVIIYLFFISISAWLWLRMPVKPPVIELVNEVISRLLQPAGYEVRSLATIINEPGRETAVSKQMTASVDLVAYKESGSLVIDVMTPEEMPEPPDWVAASEFRMATWYLRRVLRLPTPVSAVFVLADVVVDDSFVTFAQEYDIELIRVSGEEVAGIMAQNVNESILQEWAEKWFSTLLNGSPTLSSVTGSILESGGQDE